jgi:hypothetical protein
MYAISMSEAFWGMAATQVSSILARIMRIGHRPDLWSSTRPGLDVVAGYRAKQLFL